MTDQHRVLNLPAGRVICECGYPDSPYGATEMAHAMHRLDVVAREAMIDMGRRAQPIMDAVVNAVRRLGR